MLLLKDSNGVKHSAMGVAAQYFRAGADKVLWFYYSAFNPFFFIMRLVISSHLLCYRCPLVAMLSTPRLNTSKLERRQEKHLLKRSVNVMEGDDDCGWGREPASHCFAFRVDVQVIEGMC